jgi:hypothetical protein
MVSILLCLDYEFTSDDKLIYNTLLFYTTLFNDEKIANPELKEKFIRRIQELLKQDYILKFYERDNTLLELLLNGILKYMALDGFFSMSSSLMIKIVFPACFSEHEKNNERSNLIKVTKYFFENNPNVFQEFMENFNKLVNKVMTLYTSSRTDTFNVNIYLILANLW